MIKPCIAFIRLRAASFSRKLVHINVSSSRRTLSTESWGFRFAAAASDRGNLYKAIHDVARDVQQQLGGRSIDFCQLLVTTAHRGNLAQAPECLLHTLNRNVTSGQQQIKPVILGGAVQSVVANGQAINSGPGVSLLAASLPGVDMWPFHVSTPTLPPFTEQQWSKLLQLRHRPAASSSDSITDRATGSSGNDQCCAIIFSSPHFLDIEKLLQRLGNVLPGMPVAGGVTEKSAWVDTEHQYGALFCGTDVYCLGAVGCIMSGPIAMRQVLVGRCRPAGDVMTVTEAAGSIIYSLDGRPVHDAVRGCAYNIMNLVRTSNDTVSACLVDLPWCIWLCMIRQHLLPTALCCKWAVCRQFVSLVQKLPVEDRTMRELHLGLLEPSSGANPAAATDSREFVARRMTLTSTAYGRPVLNVAAHEVPVGTKVQLLLRDDNFCQQQRKQAFAEMAQQLPTAVTDASRVGLLSYRCAGIQEVLPESDAAPLCMPQVPCAGGSMQGEFAGPPSTWINGIAHSSTTGHGDAAKLHCYAATLTVLHCTV